MEPVQRPARLPKGGWLPAIALILVMAGGLVSSALALWSPKADLWRASLSWARFADGRDTGALSKLLNDGLLGGHGLATTARVLDWRVFGDLGAQVRRGCGNWLFLTEELEVHPNGGAALARRAAMVARVHTQLAARGIALIVAVVPDKTRIEAGRLCGLTRPVVLSGRLAGFEALLDRAGIPRADLGVILADLDGERYYHTDTHWNERGAAASAAAIAKALDKAGQAPAPEGEATVIPGLVPERVGDLIRLAGLDGVGTPWRPEGDRNVAESRIDQPPVAASDDLLGTSSGPPVVVIGSSYSRNANFTGFLARDLRVPVANMALDGGGFAGAATAYFANPAFPESPPKVIVWEMPERALDRPLSDSETIWDGNLVSIP